MRSVTTTTGDRRRGPGWLVWVVVLLAACDSSSTTIDAVGVVTGEVCGNALQTTAVVADGHHAITAGHAVAGGGSLTVHLADGTTIPATVAAVDPVRDIAALRIAGDELAAMSLSDRVSPTGQLVRLTDDLEVRTVDHIEGRTIGITGADIYEAPSDVERAGVRVTADIEPGYSGGPILNDDGEMVAMVFAESQRSGFVYGLAASEIRTFLERVEQGELAGAGECR